MSENQPPLQTELSRAPQPGELVPVDKRHQFDGAKFSYQRTSSRLVLWVAIIVVGFGALTAFLLLTEPGKRLLGQAPQTNVSLSSQSSQTITSTESSSADTIAPERDFTNATTDQIVDTLTSDFDHSQLQLDETQDFATFDTELEFGL